MSSCCPGALIKLPRLLNRQLPSARTAGSKAKHICQFWICHQGELHYKAKSEAFCLSIHQPVSVSSRPLSLSLSNKTIMSEHTYKFDVKMTCSGCSGAVTRVLEKAKADGVSSFTVNLETQEVIVNGTIPYDDVLAKIKKTGKEVRN
ncbi:hypothetical protein CPC08DRAFT_684788 [Agrocybe pediades]|nr:hypothetical protein CPC08DRAFT_684788 [Agrocybe pediades]